MTALAKMDASTMQNCQAIEIADIELTHLELSYSHTRIHQPGMISSLADSIARCGQISPVITLKHEDSAFVLLDGYLRIAALKHLQKETVLAQVWRHCKEPEALIMVIAKNQGRRWELVEQACLIRELQDRHHLSQEKIASMLGRDKSWVSRRLSLVCSLPEEILGWVLEGHISIWAATRVLVPLARANKTHADALARDLVKERISTRDLATFFQHYQKANRQKRELMVEHPAMFIKALHCRQEENQADFLKQGPEGRWVKDLKMTGHKTVFAISCRDNQRRRLSKGPVTSRSRRSFRSCSDAARVMRSGFRRSFKTNTTILFPTAHLPGWSVIWSCAKERKRNGQGNICSDPAESVSMTPLLTESS